MDIIRVKALELCEEHFPEPTGGDDLIEGTKAFVLSVDNISDKIKILQVVLESNTTHYKEHLLTCTDREECHINIAHEEISYYLLQELNRLGIKTDDNVFTVEQKTVCDNKLDEILASIQIINDGQEIIFNEIAELKELYFLGKKNWKEVLIGKFTEMAIGGIISETVSKYIIESVINMPELPKLLE